MKLIRFGEPGKEKPGLLLDDGRRVDASAAARDYDEIFFGSGGLDTLAQWSAENAAQAPEVDPEVRRPRGDGFSLRAFLVLMLLRSAGGDDDE